MNKGEIQNLCSSPLKRGSCGCRKVCIWYRAMVKAWERREMLG
jgi:hypothetical protein